MTVAVSRAVAEGRRPSSAPRPATPPRAPPPTPRGPGSVRGDHPRGQDRDGQLARRSCTARGSSPSTALRRRAADRSRARRPAPDRARQLRQLVPDRGPEDRRLRDLRRARRRARRALHPGGQRRQHHRLLAGLQGVGARPRLFGFQAAGAAPLVLGHPVATPRPSPRRSGSATRPLGGGDGGVNYSRGRIAAVDDAQILSAYPLLASGEGVFCEPASAASVAGLLKRVSAAGDREAPPESSSACSPATAEGPRHGPRQGAVGDRLRAGAQRRGAHRLRRLTSVTRSRRGSDTSRFPRVTPFARDAAVVSLIAPPACHFCRAPLARKPEGPGLCARCRIAIEAAAAAEAPG